MEADGKDFKELDRMILKALKESPERELSITFTDTLLKRVERRLTWRELIREFAIKTGIAAAALIILALVLIFPAKGSESPFIQMVADNWKLVSGIGFLILFTFFSDQVVLKFFTRERAAY